jgi:hypothetical protein
MLRLKAAQVTEFRFADIYRGQWSEAKRLSLS